ELKKAKADSAYALALQSFREQNWPKAIGHFAKALEYRNDLSNPSLQRFIAKEMLFIDHYKNQILDLEARLEQNQKNVEEFAREYFLMANECEVKFRDNRSAIAN